MNLLNRFKARTAGLFLALVGALTVGTAAADDVSTGIVTAITAANPQITAVITAMAGALVIIVVWSLIKRAWGK